MTCTPDSLVYTGSALTPCTVTVTGANLSLTPDPVYIGNINVGTATASYTYAGDANHTGSTGSTTFAITKAPSTTTVTCPASVVYNGSAQTPCTAKTIGVGMSDVNMTASLIFSNNTNVGTATASATYAGDANHSSSSNSKTFSILYSTGMCLGSAGHTILQPVNADGTSVFKKGSTFPAKFRVCDANGNSIGTAGVVSSFRLIQTITGTVADIDEAVISTTLVVC